MQIYEVGQDRHQQKSLEDKSTGRLTSFAAELDPWSYSAVANGRNWPLLACPVPPYINLEMSHGHATRLFFKSDCPT